jgi:2'-5' RNA ligase
MTYAINLYFDGKSERAIQHIWDELAKDETSTYMVEIDSRPHITLTIYHDIDINDFEKRFTQFTNTTHSIEIKCNYIGVFPKNKGTVFLAPTMTDDLMKMHRDFHHLFEDYGNQEWDYYKSNCWFPHCTISNETSDEVVPEIIRRVLNIFQPMKIRIESIGIVKLYPIKYLKEQKLID